MPARKPPVPAQDPDFYTSQGRAMITPEQRRAWSAKGGRKHNDPDHILDKLSLMLPALTAAQHRRLAALGRAAEAYEATPDAAEAAQ